MGKTLQELLETQFNLLYHLHMSISDFDNNDAKDNDWLFSRLCKIKNDEIEARRKGNNF
jgi:hypothetical protein